ncbi:MAG: ParB/RepB/Spo0J family partition protein [Pirellulales bacterium]
MSNQRRLGRGLEALLGRSFEEAAPVEAAKTQAAAMPSEALPAYMSRDETGTLWLDIQAIEANPYQPRKSFDEVEIADLADSMRTHGVLQPLVVRHHGEHFQLIAGERRLRAAQAAGWDRVPVQVREVADQQMAELAIVENVQRKDLNPLEKAACFQRYIEEYGCTKEDLAARIHLDRSTVANLIRLLELPEQVKQMLAAGDLTQGHARALLPLGDEHEQIKFAIRAKREALSVRAIEEAVQGHLRGIDGDHFAVVDSDGNRREIKRPVNEQILALEQELRLALGTKVDLQQNKRGKGKMVIHFQSPEEFDRIRRIVCSIEAARQTG